MQDLLFICVDSLILNYSGFKLLTHFLIIPVMRHCSTETLPWVKRQYFVKHPYIPDESLFLADRLLTESSTYICKMDLKDTVWILLRILKLSLNIRLHEAKFPMPGKPCIPDKIITSMWKCMNCLFTNNKK